ncbi:hypothetical protein SKAU_G00070820 [Synaphobranchus kaupii]|uniref:Uncharacterized protein n=1 Tax=Synaphobranchus kaupii TaxID=118154 RepID=A0A9Q1JBQ4_SYNKA|nr:hypothetical protein SKAU_G00070820 [Synaphobranchus kaupii]
MKWLGGFLSKLRHANAFLTSRLWRPWPLASDGLKGGRPRVGRRAPTPGRRAGARPSEQKRFGSDKTQLSRPLRSPSARCLAGPFVRRNLRPGLAHQTLGGAVTSRAADGARKAARCNQDRGARRDDLQPRLTNYTGHRSQNGRQAKSTL